MSISQNFPNTRPSLVLDFANSKKLDSRITFTRGSTGTYVDDNGLVRTASINAARFDHNPTTGDSLGLLIEESRTNLLQYSQALATSPWATINGGGFSVSNNVTSAPDGTFTASQTNANPFTGGDSVYQDVSVSGTGTYTLSVFVKGNTCNSITFAAFFISNTTQGFSFNYNPLTGTIVSTSGGSNHTVVPYPNGWYRIYFTVTGTNSLNNTLRFQVYTQTTGITYLWGAQVEFGSFQTSYIPTVAASVTRSDDNASITGVNFSTWYNSTEGTLFAAARINALGSGNYPGVTYVDDGTVNNCIGFYVSDATDDKIGAEAYVSGVNQYGFGSISAIVPNQLNKMITAYKANDFAGAFGMGGTVGTDNSGSVPTVNRLIIGRLRGSNAPLNGTISQLFYYPVRLPNEQLRQLTK